MRKIFYTIIDKMSLFAPLYLENASLSNLKKFLSENAPSYSRVFVLLDDNIMAHCWPMVVSAIEELNDAELIQIEPGEGEKNIDVAKQIWLTLTELKADRKSLLINLGGGVVTDLGGFVAATFKRGMDFINIPTTLLGMVDAALGGKTGVDLDGLKNQVGVFAKPKGLFLNPLFLETLPERELISGYAECVKHALIYDAELWDEIKGAKKVSVEVVQEYLAQFADIKKQVVEKDPYEQADRKKLNYGHTMGHALETILLNSGVNVTHGECIAFGMLTENYLALKSGLLTKTDFDEIAESINACFPLIKEVANVSSENIHELMKHDKKNFKNNINFSLVTKPGVCAINKQVDSALFEEAVDYYKGLL